mgnify:CR=1 FL=1
MNEDDIDAFGLFLEHDGFTIDEIDQYFLEHTGVKGMKWGVRRNRRAETLNRVGRGEGSGMDKVKAALNVSAVDLVKGRGLQGAAARKGARVTARNDRVQKGEGSVKDMLVYYGSTRYQDLLPSKA